MFVASELATRSAMVSAVKTLEQTATSPPVQPRKRPHRNLSIIVENSQLTIQDVPELIDELKLHGYKNEASGNVKYGAPEVDMTIELQLWQ